MTRAGFVKRLTQRIEASAFQPVDGSSIAVFRIIFGAAVAAYAVKALIIGEVRGIYVEPAIHFYYWGFSWLKPWPGGGMYLHFAVMATIGLLVSAGIAWRLSSIALAFLFSFVFLCERTAYLNHMYLIMLLCWMMTILPAARVASLDGLSTTQPRSVPAWCLFLVRFHVGLPYFFGGVAKLNSDWLQGQPMRMTLSQQAWFPTASDLVGAESVVALFSIGGAVFDLLVVPALLWKRTRCVAFLMCVAFHLTNAFVFPIGVFPWLMIGATTIFFPPDWPRRLLSLKPASFADSEESDARRRWVLTGLTACVVVHCALPLRHFVTQGDPGWTERGHMFAWHMMLRGKRCGLRFYATDRNTGETQIVDLRRFVTAYQYPKVGRDPEHIRQLAHVLSKSFPGRDIEVRALALVSLNGREPQLLVEPSVNLAGQDAAWTHPDWVLPLDKPLLRDHWDVPLLEWERALNLNVSSLLSLPARQDQSESAASGGDVLSSGRSSAPRNGKESEVQRG